MTRTLRTASRTHRVLVYSLAQPVWTDLSHVSRRSRTTSVQDSSRLASARLSPASRAHHKKSKFFPQETTSLSLFTSPVDRQPSYQSGKFCQSFLYRILRNPTSGHHIVLPSAFINEKVPQRTMKAEFYRKMSTSSQHEGKCCVWCFATEHILLIFRRLIALPPSHRIATNSSNQGHDQRTEILCKYLVCYLICTFLSSTSTSNFKRRHFVSANGHPSWNSGDAPFQGSLPQQDQVLQVLSTFFNLCVLNFFSCIFVVMILY